MVPLPIARSKVNPRHSRGFTLLLASIAPADTRRGDDYVWDCRRLNAVSLGMSLIYHRSARRRSP